MPAAAAQEGPDRGVQCRMQTALCRPERGEESLSRQWSSRKCAELSPITRAHGPPMCLPHPSRRPGGFAARHGDHLAVLAVLAVSLASAAWFTRSFYYFQDDFIFIRQAQTSSLSFTYLRDPLFQHFSPVSRLADYGLAHWFDSSVGAAHIIALVIFAVSVLAFSWTITELIGYRWWRHLLTLAFAESLALLHLLGWWTATANLLPATLFGLLTIAAFLRYRRLGHRKWYAISLLSYALSLCTHEQSWLVVGYLVLFDLLVLAPVGRTREALWRMWREGLIWLAYVVLTVGAMVNYFVFYYAPLKPKATIGELIRYVGIQTGQGFAPSAAGLRPLTTGWTNAATLVVDSLFFVVIVLVSVFPGVPVHGVSGPYLLWASWPTPS